MMEGYLAFIGFIWPYLGKNKREISVINTR